MAGICDNHGGRLAELLRSWEVVRVSGSTTCGSGGIVASIIMVPFHGDGAGIAELSWGQREIWTAMRTQQSWIPIGGAGPVPPEQDVNYFVAALGFMVSRHQSLRTRLRFEPDGTVRQVVADRGEIPLHVVDVPDGDDPALAAEQLRHDFHENDFDYEREWPVRIAVVRQHGVATHLVALYSHFAVDGAGVRALIADAAHLGTDAPPVTSLPPLAQAAWQESPAGQRLNRATQRHWRRQLARVSARRFADTDDEREPRHWQAWFHSPAAHLGMRSVMARTGSETSPVVLAAVAVGLARVTGHNPAALQVVVHNRFRPGLADTVSQIAQTGLCVIDVADITFDEAVERARQSTTSTYLNAYYDPDEMTELIAELGRERGEEFDLGCFFNDRRAQDNRESTDPLPTPEQIAAARAETTVRWGPHSDKPFERFFVHIQDTPDTLEVLAQSDTRYLPPDDLRAFLDVFESVLVGAAFDPATPTGVRQLSSVTRST
jgi:hypothetical protein